MELDVRTEQDGAACVLSIAGEVDVYTAPVLKQHLVDAVEQGCVDILIDLDEVGFIDSSGLGVLVGGLRRVKDRSGSIRLVCQRESILKIFRITGLDKVFPIFGSVEEARGF